MSGCNFMVNFKGSAEEIYLKTKSTIESQGGSFDGDVTGGKFNISILSNSITGSYSVMGNELHVEIDSKPMFLPCNAIQNFLASKLS